MSHTAAGAETGENVSTVMWLGYDAPPLGVSVAMTGRAEAASAPLDAFVDDLRARHQGPQPTITMIGHSYGSVVVGTADREHHLAVDNIVFIGSPGVTVDSAAQLSVGADHVYAATAPNDVIQAASPDRVLGVVAAEASPLAAATGGVQRAWADPDLRFGVSPVAPEFGAHVIDTPHYDGNPVAAHSGYFEADSPAMRAIGRIVTGQQPPADRAEGAHP